MATYHVTVTRNYGEISFTYGLSNDIAAEQSGDLVSIMMKATDYVMSAHEQAASEYVPKSLERTQATQTHTWSGPLDKATKIIDGGVTKIRLYGGSWKKYGVPVYPEVILDYPELQAFSRNPHAEQAFTGKTFTVELSPEGKPKRVIGIADA